MKFKIPYYDKKINELQKQLDQAEAEIKELKEKPINTVKIDESQLYDFLRDLTNHIDLNTDDVADEIRYSRSDNKISNRDDLFSASLKISLAGFFVLFAGILGYHLITEWSTIWSQGTNGKASLFVMCIIAFDCLVLGIDLFKEKDRNYIVSIFSALVALVALIVTLVK